MHAAIELLIFWASAFVTLGAALALLSVFSALIENDLELGSLGKEAVIAVIASFVEAAGVWLVVLAVPAEFRPRAVYALFVPAIIVAVIYKISHLEDWSRYESLFLLIFQVFIGAIGASFVMGQFLTAVSLLGIFIVALAAVIAFARSL